MGTVIAGQFCWQWWFGIAGFSILQGRFLAISGSKNAPLISRPSSASDVPSLDLFRTALENILDQRHELYRLTELIDWQGFDEAFGVLYCPDNGCPAKATRLMVGLQYLQHVYGHPPQDAQALQC